MSGSLRSGSKYYNDGAPAPLLANAQQQGGLHCDSPMVGCVHNVFLYFLPQMKRLRVMEYKTTVTTNDDDRASPLIRVFVPVNQNDPASDVKSARGGSTVCTHVV
ncbi:hypothetical protein HZH66_008906 [Vespula vulgaris]|uniref:Uncharacterized protein n=1 Tax=Vespula vulgaris TaxID=7454 RepID=A0A834JQG8_VESVU|nr:hypothetical protein HZH66_008906 [Vespula vulgaris]